MQSSGMNAPATTWNDTSESERAVRGDFVFGRVHNRESSQESGSSSSPQTPSSAEKSRTTSTTTDRSNRYQREEKFHSDLKKAASFRRPLERERETNVSTEKIQEAAIARALNAAAVEFRSSGSGQRDDSFFDTAVGLAAAGSRHPLGKTTRQGESHLVVSDDWSLPEMIGVIVSRSRSTIRQQQEEIQCLRLVVRELMHELSTPGTEAQVEVTGANNDTSTKGTDRERFSSPGNYRDPGGASHNNLRSISTPPTANTTPASSVSERGTPKSNASSGPPYSSRSPNRHLLSKGARISRSFSDDGQDSTELKEVQRSLDPKMRDTEQQNHGASVVSPADPAYSTFSEWQARQQMNSHQSPSRSTEKLETVKASAATQKPTSTTVPPSIVDQNYEKEQENSERLERAIDEGLDVPVPTSPLQEERLQTHGGKIVESIIDAIIDSSVGKTEEESTMSSLSLMFPGLQPKQVDDSDQNSLLDVGRNVGTDDIQPARHQVDIPTHKSPINDPGPLQYFGGPAEDETSDSVLEQGIARAHSDPPAHQVRRESRTIEEAVSTSVPREKANEEQRSQVLFSGSSSRPYQQRDDLPAKKDSMGSLIEGPSYGHRGSPNSKEYTHEDYEGSDDDDDADDQGKRRMVVLITGTPINRVQQTNQERSMIIVHSNGIDADFVDGAASDMREIRDSLFGVSGITGNYPQFFLVDDDGMTEFFGLFQDIEELNDAGELKSTFSRLSTTTTRVADDQLLGGSHQEEKKDEHVVQAIPTVTTPSMGPLLVDNVQTAPVVPYNPYSSPSRSRASSDEGMPHGRATPVKEARNDPEGITSSMYIREEDVSLMNPSPHHNTMSSSEMLPMIQEDHDSTYIFEGDSSSEVPSSYYEQEGDGSRNLRWI
jgi:hypothetical protein